MSGWKARRFWTAAEVVSEGDAGFGIRLDGRPLRSPAKRALIVPSRAMAVAIAAEWSAVEGAVDPHRMPVTRAANSAIDKVAVQFDEVARIVAAYGGSDHLCYRAEGPEALCVRQAEAWDPLLDWAAETFGARLLTTFGVIPVMQPAASVVRLTDAVRACSPFQLTALHDLVALSGSLVIGLAATRAARAAGDLWSLSRIDEDWQAEVWGRDEEATELAVMKRDAFLFAERFWHMATVQGE